MKEETKKLIIEIMNEDAKDGLYKQQTAVEWYAQQEIELTLKFTSNQIDQFNYGIQRIDLFNQAKAMENEQAFEIFKAGQHSMEEGGKCFDQFWETYGGKNGTQTT